MIGRDELVSRDWPMVSCNRLVVSCDCQLTEIVSAGFGSRVGEECVVDGEYSWVHKDVCRTDHLAWVLFCTLMRGAPKAMPLRNSLVCTNQ